MAEKIKEDIEAATRAVVDRVLKASAGQRDADHAIPSFAEARRTLSTIARETAIHNGRSANELMPLYEAENHRLIDELTEIKAQHDEFIGIADDEVRKVTAERDEARSEVYVLKARLKEMERAIRTKEQKPEINIPNDFDDLEAWATLYVGHSVEVLPRALYAAKKSVFDNPPLAYQALLLLNEAYAPMRQSGSQIAKERWEGGLRQLGLECTRTQSSSRAGENPNDYFVDYYEKRMEIDWHLKGSNSRDPRYCFRLYFFWAEDQGKVVVASLPSHLDSRIT